MHDDDILRDHLAEGVLLLGGGAAILLQFADPRVAHGVARHSEFRTRPLDRLFATLDYLYAIGFGDDVVATHAARTVNARHVPVRGEGVGGAPAYNAFDADAQRWVASTILATALNLEERMWGALDQPTADAIVRSYAVVGGSLQAGRAGWPQTRREFDAWWAERVAAIEVGDEARTVARVLLSKSPALPLGAGLLLPPIRLITAALLPPAIRDAYGFRWTPRASRTADAWIRAIAVIWPWLPRYVRHAPLHASLRRMNRRSRYAEHEPRGRR